MRYFGPSCFAFLKELKAHNNRDWFAANKARFVQDVEAPALQFVADLAPRLKAISPRFIADARRTGGSLFRIYRDTRFSADKTPYKTHVAMHFKHDGKGLESVPGFYLHVEPGDSMGGGGIYHPDPASLRRIRMRLAEHPGDWKPVVAAKLAVEGESLRRVPTGFPADHPRAEDLKRKDHYVMARYTLKDVQSDAFLDQYVATCQEVAPLVRFLTGALGLRW